MKSDNSNIKEKDEKQRRSGGNQKSSDYNTKKQVTKQKNNRYRSQTRQGGKYTDKQQKPMNKNAVRNNSAKNPVKSPSRQGRRNRRTGEPVSYTHLGEKRISLQD